MDKNSNAFTVLFATAVCVVLAVVLASTYNGLKGLMDDNALFDKQRNVLIAMGLYEPGDATKSRADLERIFSEQVVREVLDVTRAQVERAVRKASVEGIEKVEQVTDLVRVDREPAELEALLKAESAKPKNQRAYVEIYRGADASGKTVWCIPISGYGLWSTLYGFLALDEDLSTVRGITFYKHGETPGLGGEVDNLNWQKQWRGKKIRDDQGRLCSVSVKKGPVDSNIAMEANHMVDGLSGATITSNGVTNFLLADLQTYEPYFKKHRKS